MKNPKTRNLTIKQKARRIREEFADENYSISATTVHRIQNKLLKYSYKRIC